METDGLAWARPAEQQNTQSVIHKIKLPSRKGITFFNKRAHHPSYAKLLYQIVSTWG
jgi:hypothetical protein